MKQSEMIQREKARDGRRVGSLSYHSEMKGCVLIGVNGMRSPCTCTLYIVLGWQRIPLYACSLSLIFKLAHARVLTQSTSCQYNTVKARCVKYALISLRSQHGCME